jgi:hypothetical protein
MRNDRKIGMLACIYEREKYDEAKAHCNPKEI